jgi:hypothetical protein
VLVVKVGSTKVRHARATRALRLACAPSTRKLCSRWRKPPTNRHSPTTPVQMIMMAENTVSLATAAAPAPPASIKVTISATSMTVTDSASTKVPRGSPTLCAITSAWWTDASTAPISATPDMASRVAEAASKDEVASKTAAITGTAKDQIGM